MSAELFRRADPTTLMKAKSSGHSPKLITLSKRETLHRAAPVLRTSTQEVVSKISARSRVAQRRQLPASSSGAPGDNAEMA
jgi:hypothetical protein